MNLQSLFEKQAKLDDIERYGTQNEQDLQKEVERLRKENRQLKNSFGAVKELVEEAEGHNSDRVDAYSLRSILNDWGDSE